MDDMFVDAKEFNQDLDKWETSSLANINQMFWDATSFNGNITTKDFNKEIKSTFRNENHPKFNISITYSK
ncbi:BspA family leucine-rich repeat surface protein [Mycoplasma capricolum]|uniref:BspA family leucine-rich repeat surface protein n=1 Tax=Mycoplasma capricolum TaxID=2095 RepID=UPI003DA255AA